MSDNRKHLIRRGIDDKAYVRSGTSEGFSRPLHPPVQPTVTPFQIPSSDYPDTVGYVSPGVILLVNDMEEVSHDGNDMFKPEDVTVTVTCKPKYVYPSSATNWANDMFAVRYLFRKEHEQPENANLPNNLPDNMVDTLIMLQDSLLQYELITIPKDVLRACEGSDHLSREKLRHHVLIKRLDMSLVTLRSTEVPIAESLYVKVSELKDQLEKIGKWIVRCFVKRLLKKCFDLEYM